KSLGEWWVENPWDIIAKGHNLSCYERKRAYLNVGGRNFLQISHLTGADGDGDGPCIVAGDFRNTGQLDLVLRQVRGTPLLRYENHFPRRHYLKVSLRGRRGNRLGVGARLVATLPDSRKLVREMYPVNSFRSQMPNIVHFGLGDATRVKQLTIRWPSGEEQVLRDIEGDRHIVAEEGRDSVEDVIPGKAIQP